MAIEVISKTDVARRTREVLDLARRRGVVMVESYGEEQVVILDAIDYRLLRAVVASHDRGAGAGRAGDSLAAPLPPDRAAIDRAIERASGDGQAGWDVVLAAYLDLDISLARAAELLEMSTFELQDRLHRLGVVLYLGPESLAEGRSEVEALRRLEASRSSK